MTTRSTIYLDHAAATPVDERVVAAMQPFWSQAFHNPSATYLAASSVKKELEAARGKVAHWLGSRPSEVTFVAGGTEANNMAIHGIMRQFPAGNIVVSGIEHESVLAPAQRYDYRQVAVAADGRVNLSDLAQKIDENTVLVSVMYANNEIGTVQPIRDIAKIVADKRDARQTDALPLYFHTDACQAANYLDIHVARLGVDMLTLNGGKIYGPKQSGALYVRAGITLQPIIDGGGQERGLRSGTENLAGSIGFAAALDIAQTERRQEGERLQAIQKAGFELIAERLPAAIINGSQKYRLPNNVHLTLPGHDNERLLIQLDEQGIMAAAGSACSASNEESSHVLLACGLDDETARSSLRISMGRTTTVADMTTLVDSLAKLIA